MPKIKCKNIGVALDMFGCPNRCRHCSLGYGTNEKMSEQDLRWAAGKFRSYVRSGNKDTFFNEVTVSCWFREPDFSDNYEWLYELETELSDGEPARFELLSIWRLARDKKYAEWAKKVGPDTCQITFFGLEETNDWFYRRKGAFQDNLTATQRLLEVGIKPRWQIFLTKKSISELGQLLQLIDQLKLREKVQALGGKFVAFIHTPCPDGEAGKIEYLRPTIEETKSIPSEIIEASKKHMKVNSLWCTEGKLIGQVLNEDDKFPYAYSYPNPLWFFVDTNWDVFSNIGTLEPWWKLGNLKADSLQKIFDNFENNKVLGLKTIYSISAEQLARRFGNPDSLLIYEAKSDLEALFVARYCEQVYCNNGYK